MGLLDLFNGGQPQSGLPPSPEPASPDSQFDPLFDQASKETGIPAAILKAQAKQESWFNPNAVGKAGEVGLLQIMPSTAAQPGYGVEPLDPARLSDPGENVRFGARYLAARARHAGVENWNDPEQVAKALTAYNGNGDVNYAQNVFRHLKPPGGSGGPASGPVDMYGNPQPQRAAGQAATQEPTASPQPQRQAPVAAAPAGDSFVSYANQSAIRSKPLQPELVSAMGFLPQLGVTMRVTSGGQDGQGEGNRRTGSTRHDHGGAGDVQFMRDGKPLSWENPQDVPVLQQIVRQARQNGVTGIGAGPGYMNPTTTHIGFGKAAIWGAKGGLPYQALAEAVSDVPAGVAAAQPSQGRNPTLTAAAERGRGPAADRPARGSAMTIGQMPMPSQPIMDTTSPDNAGVLEFLRQQAGQGQEAQAAPSSGRQGGLGGLGGFLAQAIGGGQPQQASGDVASLIPRPAADPFALFGERAQHQQQVQAEWKGKVFTAQQLVAQGMSPQDAAATVNAPPLGQQLALGGIKQQREAAVNADVSRRLAGGEAPQSEAATPPGPIAPAQSARQTQAEPPAGGHPEPAPAQAQTGIATGNRTVDALFSRRDAKLKEYRQTSDHMIRATTDASKAHVGARLKAIEAEIGGIDEKMKQYAPTGLMREYTFAMMQRQLEGLPTIPLEQFDIERRKASKTEVTVKNEGTIPPGYRMRRDEAGNPAELEAIPGGPVDAEVKAKAEKSALTQRQAQAAGGVVINALDDIDKLMAGATLWTTGAMGSRVADIGGTAAHDIANALTTIKANISFDRLGQMRAASPTGGALGAVSDTETKLLSNSAAALEQSQSEAQFKVNLARLRAQYNEIVHGPQTTRPDGSSPPSPTAAPQVRDGSRAEGPNGQIITLRNGQWVPE